MEYHQSSLESSSSTSIASSISADTPDVGELCETYKNFKVLESNDQIKELQTILRDKWGWNLVYAYNKYVNLLADLQQEMILYFMPIVW